MPRCLPLAPAISQCRCASAMQQWQCACCNPRPLAQARKPQPLAHLHVSSMSESSQRKSDNRRTRSCHGRTLARSPMPVGGDDDGLGSGSGLRQNNAHGHRLGLQRRTGKSVGPRPCRQPQFSRSTGSRLLMMPWPVAVKEVQQRSGSLTCSAAIDDGASASASGATSLELAGQP